MRLIRHIAQSKKFATENVVEIQLDL